MADPRLNQYQAKRRFEKTSEPPASSPSEGQGTSFVVQKHAARRLHYDFRLEVDGVLASWAVPKGPSYDPKTKRLAMRVEDHPFDYRDFEGIIPPGEYGAGAVIVWDRGTYQDLTDDNGKPLPARAAIERGHLSFWLEGQKLQGGWSLTRTRREATGREAWILVKRRDDHAGRAPEPVESEPTSVLSGRTVEELAAAAASLRNGAGGVAGTDVHAATSPNEGRPRQWTRQRATWRPPMLATLYDFAAKDRALHAGEWLFERKLDGLRCLAVRNDEEVRLWSRNHLSFDVRFPHLVEAFGRLGANNFVIDGEVVAFDGELTSFSLLQRPRRDTRPVFCAFDLVHLLGQDITELPFSHRRRLLTQLLEGTGDDVVAVPTLEGGVSELMERACASGWEGLVAKRVDSPYCSGRSGDWRKLKCSASQELVIGGWTDPAGSRVGLGALLVGYHDDAGALRYAGKVGTGFDQATLRSLRRQMEQAELESSPFVDPGRVKSAHWTEPTLVAQVAFSEWTGDGRLRHPRFEGLRADKDPREVRRELR